MKRDSHINPVLGSGVCRQPAAPSVPVADKRRDDILPSDNHDDSEINVIPYLQDYLPFATKRPPSAAPPSPTNSPSPSSTSPSSQALGGPAQGGRIVLGSGTSAPPTSLQPSLQPQPLSVTLKTVTPGPAGPGLVTIGGPPSRHETVIGGASGGSEFTVGAVMHTLSNHRPSEGEAASFGNSPDLNDHGFQVSLAN